MYKDLNFIYPTVISNNRLVHTYFDIKKLEFKESIPCTIPQFRASFPPFSTILCNSAKEVKDILPEYSILPIPVSSSYETNLLDFQHDFDASYKIQRESEELLGDLILVVKKSFDTTLLFDFFGHKLGIGGYRDLTRREKYDRALGRKYISCSIEFIPDFFVDIELCTLLLGIFCCNNPKMFTGHDGSRSYKKHHLVQKQTFLSILMLLEKDGYLGVSATDILDSYPTIGDGLVNINDSEDIIIDVTSHGQSIRQLLEQTGLTETEIADALSSPMYKYDVKNGVFTLE
jgi:hypothetical protein